MRSVPAAIPLCSATSLMAKSFIGFDRSEGSLTSPTAHQYGQPTQIGHPWS
jgi:hypothetical protein